MTSFLFTDMTVNIGDKAPSFELVDTDLKMRTLDEFKGKKVVLSFFVAASSPVCTNEMCTFRDSLSELSGLGAQVVAISNDGPFANKAFAEKYNLKFPVLGDYKSKTIRDYDILMPHLLHVKDYDAAKRSVFIVDENGKIVYKWVSDNPLVEPNYKEIKDFLKKGN
ncbi:MAG: redoxin domain-containing protein [Nitrosopumilaceae archaeon]|nr:redoxin domain-containing protein [Nitrosopumilaceae archaeon]